MIDLPPPTSTPIPLSYTGHQCCHFPLSLSSFFSQLFSVCLLLLTRRHRIYFIQSLHFCPSIPPTWLLHYCESSVFYAFLLHVYFSFFCFIVSVFHVLCCGAGRAVLCLRRSGLRLRDIPDIITAFDYPPDWPQDGPGPGAVTATAAANEGCLVFPAAGWLLDLSCRSVHTCSCRPVY